MTQKNSFKPTVKHLKLLASKLAKELGLSRSQSLDKVSQNHGFKDWREFKLNAVKNHDPSKTKVQFYNYNSSLHSIDQIEGLETSKVQITQRCINLVSDHFSSLNSLRHHLNKEIKELKSSYKDRLLFCLHIYISFKTAELIKDEDKFFQAFVDREGKIFSINKVVTNTPPSVSEMESTISDFNSYFQSAIDEV